MYCATLSWEIEHAPRNTEAEDRHAFAHRHEAHSQAHGNEAQWDEASDDEARLTRAVRDTNRRPSFGAAVCISEIAVKVQRFRTEHGDGPRGFSRWVQPRMSKYLLACCDCSLIHEMQFRVLTRKYDGKQIVQFRARRAERYTARERKRRAR